MPLRPVNAEFIATYKDPTKVPKFKEPQIICIGRSNVGKSTLINRLAGQKKLARTSNTPGRTQSINLFRVFLKSAEGEDSSLIIADLPGYGYAKVSKKDRKYFEDLILGYLDNVGKVAAVLLLQDIRRNLGEEELVAREIAFENGHVVFVVLTKVDKLKKNDVKKSAAKITKAFSLEDGDIILAGEKIPISNLYKMIEPLL
ncbi:MAG: ribosome biogenesis GTP-binding protein YihA/YsxC [Bdellovibrionota bacterium]